MSKQIIAKTVAEINLESTLLEVEGTTIDLKAIFQTESDSEDAWIYVTPIVKEYKGWSGLAKFYRNESVKEYINLVTDEILKEDNLSLLKSGGKVPYSRGSWLKADWLNYGETPLIIKRSGRQHGGTWVHKEIFVELIATMDVKFRRTMHKLLMSAIAQARIVKAERKETIFRFHPLTDAIRDIYIPAQTYKSAKDWAYSDLMNLINFYVIGMTAKDYREEYNLDNETPIRNTFTEAQLKQVHTIEQHMHGLLLYGKVTDYSKISDELDNILNFKSREK